jgi:hypothetical protein
MDAQCSTESGPHFGYYTDISTGVNHCQQGVRGVISDPQPMNTGLPPLNFGVLGFSAVVAYLVLVLWLASRTRR